MINPETFLLAEISENIKSLQLQLDYEKSRLTTALGGDPVLYDVAGTGAIIGGSGKFGTGSAIAGATLQVDGSLVIGDGAGGTLATVTSAGKVVAQGYRSGRKESLADDTVYTITPVFGVGIIILTMEVITTGYVMMVYRALSSPMASAMLIGSSVEVVNPTILTNGSGTDGKLTVTCYSDGNIYISNRLGGNRNFNWFIIS